ncbi:MAG TPA: heparinase II/III family protein [Capsulimonadaceae bacterium]|jgi:hypothetical protein
MLSETLDNSTIDAQLDWTSGPSAATIRRHLPATWSPSVPNVANRDAWTNGILQLPPDELAIVNAHVAVAMSANMPHLLASHRLHFERTGTRDEFDANWRARRGNLAWLTIAECVEGRGRYIDKIQDLAWATCEECSWELPAHCGGMPNADRIEVDLGTAMAALQLAELDHLLDGSLHPHVHRFIQAAVRAKCIEPYMAREDWWWLRNTPTLQVNNWAAVCTAGAVGAAVYLMNDPAELAALMEKALPTLSDYLDGFDSSGALSEGIGYWNYGLGYFTMAADLIDRRSGGAINLWSNQRFRNAADFPARAALSPGRYPSFSDSCSNVELWRPIVRTLAQRLDLSNMAHVEQMLPIESGLCGESTAVVMARELMWNREANDSRSESVENPYDWFPGVSWLIARSPTSSQPAMVLAVKAGNNGEMHNQNDVGSFLVEVDGEQLIEDLGAGRYTKQYFSDSRYELFSTSSRSHSTLEVDGHAQRPGKECGARDVLLIDNGDVTGLTMDLAPAYPDALGLLSCVRTVAMERGDVTVIAITDEATFENTGRIASVLMTRHQVAVSENGVTMTGSRTAIRCGYDAANTSVRVETVNAVPLSGGAADVHRIVFEAQTGKTCKLALQISALPMNM